tara:strand:- start:23977 stop:26010 length:2034 start_codon:yes stop_codon:yes gene_type:complete
MENARTNSESVGGYRDSRGEWRPENPVSYAPIFVFPPKLKQFLIWLVNYLFTWNLFYLGIVLLSYYYLQPPLEQMKTFSFSWISILLIRNMALVWIIYGGWHLYLYILKKKGNKGKYNPRWQSTDGSTFLWNNQVYDNVFWTCASAVPIWTAYEVFTFWLYANGKLPYLDFQTHPVWFVLIFLLVPFWREFHFYFIHRLIHWKPLYDKVHYLHHYNINPGPWSGLAMHPVEHLLYFSVVLIHWVVPSHPLHFLFNSQHTALTPAPGHTGFEGKLGKFLSFGSYFHYLHHRLFECNYGESTIPLDKWFGIFEDGSQTQTERLAAANAFRKFTVTKVVDESPEVKSFYLKCADHAAIKANEPGQHLTIKLPFHKNKLWVNQPETDVKVKYTMRNYSISDISKNGEYRISVKKENKGLVSSAMHESLREGDVIEARGPKGSFVFKPKKGKPGVFIAAGIGITPILSMLKTVPVTNEDSFVFLAVKERKLLTFKDEIVQLCQANPGIKVFVFFSREKGDEKQDVCPLWECYHRRLDVETIKEILPTNRHFNFYLCGPHEMTQSFMREITNWKGRRSPIHFENFTPIQLGKNRANSNTIVQVNFKKSGKTVEWDNEYRNILEFAESNGIRMEAGCMFGECGACSTNIVEGKVDYNYKTAIKPANGKCLPCSCFPESDLVLDA